jgi:uncharacterized alpha-E superfamily protein
VNLVRGSDQQFKAIGDETRALAGCGYAVENRTAFARVYPELMRDCRIYRLSSFFRTLRETLSEISPHRKENPRIGVLTPGNISDTYFEHAYFASYLGYTLVQGEDLTVRNGILKLKTLDGLKQMDILLRRVVDENCDPLELRADSLNGVAGLLEAVRCENVVLANPVGSSILENTGLMAFLPVLSKYFFNEDLMLPSVQSWWCGKPESLSLVLDTIESLIVKPIAPWAKPILCAALSRNQKAELVGRINAKPYLYAAQEALNCATAPSVSEDKWVPRYYSMKTFMVVKGDGYEVMPGGLSITASDPETLQLDSHNDTVSKDVWVPSRVPQEHVSLWLQPDRLISTLKSTSVLPSRVAENLFWAGRYAERAEGSVRLLRTILRQFSAVDRLEDTADAKSLGILLSALTQLTNLQPEKYEEHGAKCMLQPDEELVAIVRDLKRTRSLAADLQQMITAARSVRHLWSMDSWRVINSIEECNVEFQKLSPLSLRRLVNQLDKMVTAMMAFAGLNSESMTREQGWLLLDIGRRIERGLFFARLLELLLVKRHDTQISQILLEALLATTENIITYRTRYRSYLQVETVLDLLLLDQANPRSLIYQIKRLEKHIGRLPRNRIGHRLSEEERLALKASSLIRLSDVVKLTETSIDKNKFVQLEEMLSQVSDLLAGVSDVMTQTYFSHAPLHSQLFPEIKGALP